jgi:energy-coupling factor transporter transmembrane protein EcfT
MISHAHIIFTLLALAVIILPGAVVVVTRNFWLGVAAAIIAVVVGGLWYATRSPKLALGGFIMLMLMQWAFVPTGKVPHFRVQSIRIRLRLRLHPGHGFATAPTITNHWGRFASFWASKRTRPRLGRLQRALHPRTASSSAALTTGSACGCRSRST